MKRKHRTYLDVWLKRLRKEFSSSGRLTEIAFILSKEDGVEAQVWQLRLRELVDGEMEPDLDLITRLEAMVAKPGREGVKVDETVGLFD